MDHQDEEFGDYYVQILQSFGSRKSYAFAQGPRKLCSKTSDQIIGLLPEPTLTAGKKKIGILSHKVETTCFQVGRHLLLDNYGCLLLEIAVIE